MKLNINLKYFNINTVECYTEHKHIIHQTCILLYI